MRVHLHHGSSKLVLDSMRLGSVGGELRWESQNLPTSTSYYDLEIIGGTSELTVTTTPDATRAGPEGTAGGPAWGAQNVPGSGPQDYPTLAEVLQHLMNPDAEHRFAFGVQILLDGLEQRLQRRSANA
jgi:hypothetical protein